MHFLEIVLRKYFINCGVEEDEEAAPPVLVIDHESEEEEEAPSTSTMDVDEDEDDDLVLAASEDSNSESEEPERLFDPVTPSSNDLSSASNSDDSGSAPDSDDSESQFDLVTFSEDSGNASNSDGSEGHFDDVPVIVGDSEDKPFEISDRADPKDERVPAPGPSRLRGFLGGRGRAAREDISNALQGLPEYGPVAPVGFACSPLGPDAGCFLPRTNIYLFSVIVAAKCLVV